MKKDTFILNIDLDEKTESLSDEEVGQVIRKIFKYIKGEPLPKLAKHLEMVFSFIRVDIDKNNKKYQDRCEKNKLAIQNRWNKNNTNEYECIQTYSNNTDNDNEYDNEYESSKEDKKEIKTKKKFIKPTIEEVSSYCLERNNKVDAQRFIDYYDANGWKVGRNAMKDWKAAIRTWEKNDGSFSNKRVNTKQIEQELPEWFNKDLHNIPITEEDKQELDDILNSIENSIEAINGRN
jgi:hypothetical protein